MDVERTCAGRRVGAWEQQRHNCPTIHKCHLPTVPLTLASSVPPMLSGSVSMHSLTPEYSPGGAGGWINPRSLRNLFSCRQLNPSSFQFSSSKSMSLLLSILARLKSIFKQSPSRLAPPTDDRSGTGRTKVEAAISAIFGHLLLCHPSHTGGKRL